MEVMSVSSLNEKIKSLLEATFMHIRVEGEIASVTYHRSGHVYFSIKDKKSSIKCVLWRSNASKLKFRLEKGEHVVIDGSIGVYSPRGEYQILVAGVEPYGIGALAFAFEQMKKRLDAKGYFDKSTKKEIPGFPKKIAIITAAGGAALQDMLKVSQNRWPLLEIYVMDVLVQGEGAAKEIADAILYADRLGMDIIVVGRGGGSVEDLWSFNEEVVADAIYMAKTPVVSAVGHEVDILISDFVADLRAPTPSAAMEMILPDMNEIAQILDERIESMVTRMKHIISNKTEYLESTMETMSSASTSYKLSRLSDLFETLEKEYGRIIDARLEGIENGIAPIRDRMNLVIRNILDKKESHVNAICDHITRYRPELRRKKGWAEVSKNGKKIYLDELEKGDIFIASDGSCAIHAECLEKNSIR